MPQRCVAATRRRERPLEAVADGHQLERSATPAASAFSGSNGGQRQRSATATAAVISVGAQRPVGSVRRQMAATGFGFPVAWKSGAREDSAFLARVAGDPARLAASPWSGGATSERALTEWRVARRSTSGWSERRGWRLPPGTAPDAAAGRRLRPPRPSLSPTAAAARGQARRTIRGMIQTRTPGTLGGPPAGVAGAIRRVGREGAGPRPRRPVGSGDHAYSLMNSRSSYG